ncbi:hypothetical protein [Acinetobacter sp. WCHAc060025]|uniref:hypothetical protein n=1 Tax=Acinetobacter sp. WCHAc060025 TaxID=2518625 RepID=UPI0013EE891A|nr:hypothetical protein [Acinetobacter sp. WCHAc060025]
MSFKIFSQSTKGVIANSTATPSEPPKEHSESTPKATPGSTPPNPNKDNEQPNTTKPK